MKEKLVVILPNIRSLYNIGSIFRTADAIGVEKIILTGRSGRPDKQSKIEKTSLGAEKSVTWEYEFHTWRLIEKLKKQGFEIVGLELTKNSLDYRKYKPKNKVAIILGNEVSGIAKSLLNRCDKIIHLPMVGKKESLNVAVAFSVIGYFIKFKG
jgi:tRNA G18 (ribose-2'-O)-methylase SpoU